MFLFTWHTKSIPGKLVYPWKTELKHFLKKMQVMILDILKTWLWEEKFDKCDYIEVKTVCSLLEPQRQWKECEIIFESV